MADAKTDAEKAGDASAARKRTAVDFRFGDALGEGSYSTVVFAEEIATGKEFAVKILEKKHIIKENKIKYVNTEKLVLNALNHPFFVRLYYTFQDAQKLYFVLTYAKNGELLDFIKKLGSFDEKCTQYYAAEIVLALEHMHGLGIIHRDLKPENILLDRAMHIKITDFGTAKILSEPAAAEATSASDQRAKANSFVGTAEYVSPELLTQKCACKSSDLWALGCIVYQLLAGRPPFRAGNEYQIFQKITKLEYAIPDGFPPAAKDLVEKLLVLDPDQRFGAENNGGFAALKAHPFFEGVNWSTLTESTPPDLVPYLPACKSGDADLHGDIVLSRGDDKDEIFPEDEARDRAEPPADSDRSKLLAKQAAESKWHQFTTTNELIIKTGIVNKRKGLFSKRRQLILTDLPRLLYIDTEKMIVKGEIPWSASLQPEFKNARTFFIHTPKRTYYLEDPGSDAKDWCDSVSRVLTETTQAPALV
eukprot:Opistho-2@15451